MPLSFDVSTISNLYLKEKLSTRQIAAIYKCSKSTISAHLIKVGIQRRNHSESKKLRPNPDKYTIPYSKLVDLYHAKKLSAYQIANLYHCSPSAIFHKLRRENIPRRNLSESVSLTNSTRLINIAKANVQYPKKDFCESLTDKSYLIGFRLGDLHVSKRPYGVTIVVQCWSTKPEQIILIKQLFNSYGHIKINKRLKWSKEDIGITCYLNTSFEFLLDHTDSIPEWIINKQKFLFAFIAGYVDAEGNFGVDRDWGRFSLSSYQKNILHQIHIGLNRYKIRCPKPYISIKEGYTDKRGIVTRNNLWTLRVNRQGSIIKFCNKLIPYMKHKKRICDAKLAYQTALSLAS